MIDAKTNLREYVESCLVIHGHRCPGVPLGIRAGLAALKQLGMEHCKNKELYCRVEVGPSHAMHCFADGVQFGTGCTFGKGNMVKQNYAKFGFTLINVAEQNAVRVVINPELQKKTFASEFFKARKNGIEPQDIAEDIGTPMIENVLKQPEQVLFKISEVFPVHFTPPKGTFEWIECEMCGEIIFGCGIRVKDGKKVCLPCSGYAKD